MILRELIKHQDSYGHTFQFAATLTFHELLDCSLSVHTAMAN